MGCVEVSRRASSPRVAGFALAACLGAGGVACETEAASARAEPAATSAARSGAARKDAQRKRVEDLTAPPPNPPADARTSAGGVRWVLLAAGAGAPPGPEQSVTAEITTWTRDGRLAFTTYADGGGATFGLGALPAGFRKELTQLPPGAKARFWIPASALAGWKPEPWPSEDLIVDYELVKVGEPARVRVSTRDGVVLGGGSSFPAPGATPPPHASKAPGGISHVELRAGQGPAVQANATLKVRLDAWSLSESSVSRVLQAQEVSMRVDSAPELLRAILLTLRPGGARRVWLPPELAQSVLPAAENKPAVLDLELLEIRS